MAQMILEGTDIEARDSSFGDFFHRDLRFFHPMSILIQRSLYNVLLISYLGGFILELISDINPALTISGWFLTLLVGAPGIITCKLYYKSLEKLGKAKKKEFLLILNLLLC